MRERVTPASIYKSVTGSVRFSPLPVGVRAICAQAYQERHLGMPANLDSTRIPI